MTLVLERTPFGRRLYAVGSNPQAAPYALISPRAIWTATYALSALFAAMAGVLLLGFTGSAYGDVGQPYLFQTIAAVVIGGTTLVGGRGGLIGTAAGALVLTEINTLLIGLGLSPAMVEAALGVLILALVSLYGREPHVRASIFDQDPSDALLDGARSIAPFRLSPLRPARKSENKQRPGDNLLMRLEAFKDETLRERARSYGRTADSASWRASTSWTIAPRMRLILKSLGV